MGGFGAFGWSELFSMVTVFIALCTICVTLSGKTTQNTRNTQRLCDKLDSLQIVTDEIKTDVRTVSKQVESFSVRLAKIEVDVNTLKARVAKIEGTVE